MAAERFVPDCPCPVTHPKTPRYAAPPGACDCHFHVFGPYQEFPLSPVRGYTPPEAPVSAYRRVMEALCLERCVIVQPSVYGTDNSATLKAASDLGGPDVCRVVAVIDEGLDDVALAALHEAGVRGVRVNAVAGGGPLLDRIGAIAGRIAPLGWHVQLYLPPAALAEVASRLPDLPTEVVIDHFGGSAGTSDEVFIALLRLLDSGRAWVKLSAAYIASKRDAPWGDIASVAMSLAERRPDRLVWGTNWPHPVRLREMPDDGDLLDALHDWLPDRTVMDAILRRNPKVLYDW